MKARLVRLIAAEERRERRDHRREERRRRREMRRAAAQNAQPHPRPSAPSAIDPDAG
jgi:hypothetical protein